MKTLAQSLEPVVMLVDSRARDLPVATLMAHHLRELGVECFLEPLESYRAVLAAYRPGLIIFNHLTASHLAAYSRRLAEMGVLTAVLPNEGISYDAEERLFNSGQHHRDAHIDFFFCWNEPHRQTLLQLGFADGPASKSSAFQRFDFTSPRVHGFITSRPRELRPVCGSWFAPILASPSFTNCRARKATNFSPRGRTGFPSAGITGRRLRTITTHAAIFSPISTKLVNGRQIRHRAAAAPARGHATYRQWHDRLSPAQQTQVVIDSASNITSLILQCDLEISCENCTTALESWVAGKRTVELVFARNPMFFTSEHAACNVLCDNPDRLVPLVEAQLQNSPA